MAVPKQHRSKSRQGQRRMHIYLKVPNLVPCQTCGNLKLPHIVCSRCGYYKGKEVIDVKAKLSKKEKKKLEKEMKEREKEKV